MLVNNNLFTQRSSCSGRLQVEKYASLYIHSSRKCYIFRNLWHIYCGTCLIAILAVPILANNSPKHTYESQHKTILADLNRYMANTCLIIILMDDAISTWHALGHRHDVISISRTIYWYHISNFSFFSSPAKEKGKKWKMKGVNMVQWINLKWNNKAVY